MDSKHNFDCLIIETSGLARPDKFVAELEEVGIHLDMTVAVVDAELLDKISQVDIVKKQLQQVDIVLLNKCDLANLGQVSDAEDILEGLTGGAKVVRSQFCKVPLDLVIDCSKIEALNTMKEEYSVPGILSHEALPKMTFRRNMFGKTSLSVSSIDHKSDQPVAGDGRMPESLQSGISHGSSFSSVTFESEYPLSLSMFQSRVLPQIRRSKGLLRAKGIIWFAEDRESRFVFQWSGVKRVEAISGDPWQSAPKSRIVFIGTDKSELEAIIKQLSESVGRNMNISTANNICKEHARSFSMMVARDGRFKEPALVKESLVIFGLKGSPLRGIKESDLSGPLMRLINGRGNMFISATTFGEDYNLQLLLDERSDPDNAWNEIRMAASAVISKLCKNFCPCRSDLSAHAH